MWLSLSLSFPWLTDFAWILYVKISSKYFIFCIIDWGLMFFQEKFRKFIFPQKWLDRKMNGTIRKCSSSTFQIFVMSLGFYNFLAILVSRLCWRKSPSVIKWLNIRMLYLWLWGILWEDTSNAVSNGRNLSESIVLDVYNTVMRPAPAIISRAKKTVILF
jgi:hypothetical protein